MPYGKISDRTDFEKLDTDTRIKYWQTVLAESERLADDFANMVENNEGLDAVQAIEPIFINLNKAQDKLD